MNIPNAPMKHRSTLFAVAMLLVLLTVLTSSPAYGQANQYPPGKMTFQGFLTDASNPPVPLGNANPENKSVTFKIYKTATGTVSTDVVWAESQVVTVDKGHFSVLLGEGSSVSGLPHTTDLSTVFIGADASERWLGITVDGGEITPRIQFFAAPYAQLAKAANTLVSGAQTGPLTASGSVDVNGLVSAKGASAGLTFQDRSNNVTSWQWYGDAGTARLWNGSDRITVSSTGALTASSMTANGLISANGSSAGLSFQERSSTTGTTWQWYSDNGSARLWSGGDKITVNSAGVIGSSGLSVGGSNVIELGVGVSKEANAGKIGYQTFTAGALDIIGAGTSGTGRKIRLWDDVTIAGLASIGGNVGIKTASPTVPLEVSSSGWGILQSNGGIQVGSYAGGSLNGGYLGTKSNHKLAFITNDSGPQVTLDTSGYLGIGTTSPAVPLDVASAKDIDYNYWTGILYGYGSLLNWGGDHAASSQSGVNEKNVSIRAAGGLTGKFFYTTSDARIKQLAGHPVGRELLDSIRQLKVADYSFVDYVANGRRLQRGLIAQEVEKVMPEAVSQSSDVVPSIYAHPIDINFDADSKSLTIRLEKPHGLATEDVVSLIMESGRKEAEVLAVPSSTSFVVAAESEPTKVFVFGKRVDDFRTVNYDRIFTTGIGAIQELDRQVQALKQSEARIATLEKRVSELESMEREMVEMKRLLSVLVKPGSAQDTPASLVLKSQGED